LGESAQLQYFDSKFVPKDSRISEKRLIAPESMDVSPANPNPMYPNQSLIGLKRARCRFKTQPGEAARLF
jgi:hypothetical protein